jgi:hypothetical protein
MNSKFLFIALCLFALRAQAQVEASLLTWLTFEDRSANPVDSSGTKTKTTLIGRAGYGRGAQAESAIKLVDGAHLKLENRKAYQKETQAITVAFWTKATVFPASSRLVQKGIAGEEWQVEINYKGEFVWSVFTKKPVTVYTQPPKPDTWVHIAVTYDRGVGRVYFDGKQANIRTIEAPGDLYYSRFPVIIGGGWDANEQTVMPFTGFIDDFRIYNRALSAAEIAALAQH